MKEYCESHQVFHVTLGRLDTLIVPFGWSFVEQNSDKHDMLGVRLAWLDKRDIPHVHDLADALAKGDKPNDFLKVLSAHLKGIPS